MNVLRSVVCAGILLIAGLPAMAQQSGAAGKSPAVTGFRGDFLTQLDGVEKKLVDLANAEPAEKFSWRPEEGVRSISEVYVHVSGANYFFLSLAGIKQPEGLSRDMEKTVTQKADVVAAIKKGFDFARDAVSKMSDEDLSKPVKMFGQETTVQGLLFVMANHMHEHLGQAIAYARMNGVVPPWTAEQMKAQKAKQGKGSGD